LPCQFVCLCRGTSNCRKTLEIQKKTFVVRF
jgi:hypothetical protein